VNLQLSNGHASMSEQLQQLTSMLHAKSQRDRQIADSEEAAETAMMHMAAEISRLHSKSLSAQESAAGKVAASTLQRSAGDGTSNGDPSTPEVVHAARKQLDVSPIGVGLADQGTQTIVLQQAAFPTAVTGHCSCTALRKELVDLRTKHSLAIANHAAALQKVIKSSLHKVRDLAPDELSKLEHLQTSFGEVQSARRAVASDIRKHVQNTQREFDSLFSAMAMMRSQMAAADNSHLQAAALFEQEQAALRSLLQNSHDKMKSVTEELAAEKERFQGLLVRLQFAEDAQEKCATHLATTQLALCEVQQQKLLVEKDFEDSKVREADLQDQVAAGSRSLIEQQNLFAAAQARHSTEMTQVRQAFETAVQEQVDAAIKASYKAVARLEATNRALNDEIIDMKGRVRVLCRLRPAAAGCASVAVTPHPKHAAKIQADDQTGTMATFEFDAVCGPEASQHDVFQHVKPVIESCLNGNNICLFAYGQTGAGKTYTMCGTDKLPGLIQLSVAHLFSCVELSPGTTLKLAQVSALDIYNESLRDMLAPSGAAAVASLDICTPRSSTASCVQGLSQRDMPNYHSFEGLFNQARQARTVGSHSMNKESSRSHLVVTIYFELLVSSGGKKDKVVTSKVQFIDLAGSERLSRTGAEGMTAVEAQSINASLSTLGLVMATLRKAKKKSTHVPYRNSKLTHLLQDSLAGTSKVIMVVNVAAEAENSFESASSLEFGSRCRAVELKAVKKKTSK